MIPGEYFPLELRRRAVDSIHILEVIGFRIPFNFALPGHTDHRVGEDVDSGICDPMSLFTQ